MNRLAQVGHVIANDVRRTRWYLALYAAAVVLTTLFAVGPQLGSYALLDLGAVVIVAVGMLTLATLVQGDSPSRIDSYWKTLPLDPMAVVVAKLALAAAMIVLAAIGAFIVFGVLGAPAALAARQLAGAAVAFGLCTLAVLVAAAITPDLRTLLLLLLAALIGWILLGVLFQSATGVAIEFGHLPSGTPVVLTAAAGVGALLALGVLYRRRDVRWLAWTVAFVLASAAMVSPLFDSVHPRTERAPVPVQLGLERADSNDPEGAGGFPLRVTASGAPADVQIMLMVDSIAVRPRHGAAARAHRRGFRVTLQEPQLPAFAGMRWPYGEPGARAAFDAYLNRRSDEPVLAASEIAGVDVFGRIVESRLVPVARMPFHPAASVFASGGRAQFQRILTASDSLRLMLRLLTVRTNPRVPFAATIDDFGAIRLDLVNDARREVLPVTLIGMGGGSVGVVLAQNLGYDYDLRFRASTHPGGAGTTDSLPPVGWYDGAHVQLSEFVRLQPQPVHLVYTAGQ